MPLPLFLQLIVDHPLEALEAAVPEELTIHVDGGSAPDTGTHAVIQITIDKLLDRRIFPITIEFFTIQAYFLRNVLELRVTQAAHVLKYLVMIFPELSLVEGALPGFGSFG